MVDSVLEIQNTENSRVFEYDASKDYSDLIEKKKSGRFGLSEAGRKYSQSFFSSFLLDDGSFDSRLFEKEIENLQGSAQEAVDDDERRFTNLLVKSLSMRERQFHVGAAKELISIQGGPWAQLLERLRQLDKYKNLPDAFVLNSLANPLSKFHDDALRYSPTYDLGGSRGKDPLIEQLTFHKVAMYLNSEMAQFSNEQLNRTIAENGIGSLFEELARGRINRPTDYVHHPMKIITMRARAWSESPEVIGVNNAIGQLNQVEANNLIDTIDSERQLANVLRAFWKRSGDSELEIARKTLECEWIPDYIREDIEKQEKQAMFERGYSKRGIVGRLLEKLARYKPERNEKATNSKVGEIFERYMLWKGDERRQANMRLALVNAIRLTAVAMGLVVGVDAMLEEIDDITDKIEFSSDPSDDVLHQVSREILRLKPGFEVVAEEDNIVKIPAESHTYESDEAVPMIADPWEVDAIADETSSELIDMGLYAIDKNSSEYQVAVTKIDTLQSDLERTIAELVEDVPGEWGVAVKKVGDESIYGFNLDTELHPASVIKIPIAIAFYKWAEDSGLIVEEALDIIPPGEYRKMEILLADMLIRSDEVATEAISQYINDNHQGGIDRLLESLGAASTEVYPRFTTARDLTELMEDLYSGNLLSQDSTSQLLSILRTPSADDASRIGAPLSSEDRATLAHKIGTVLGDGGLVAVSDAGIITLENGDTYIVTVLNELDKAESYPDAVVGIQEISEIAYHAFSPEAAVRDLEPNDMSVIHIPPEYANLGRLNNLLVVGEKLDGYVLQPGETLEFNSVIELFASNIEYMKGYAYGTSDSTAFGGGICGIVAALATEAERLGLTFDSPARHLPTDHAPGGIYENLVNASTSTDRPFTLTNNSDQPVTINISFNFDRALLDSVGGEWDDLLDPQKEIGGDEFQVSVSLISDNADTRTDDVSSDSVEQTASESNDEDQKEEVSMPDRDLETEIATASYENGEYFNEVLDNMRIAKDLLNSYFEENSITVSSDGNFTFSYLDVMDYFQDDSWEATSTLTGAGACDIATLIYRAMREYSDALGVNLVEQGRDNTGHDILSNIFVTIRKINHTPYSNMPADEIAVAAVTPNNIWNSDLQIALNGNYLPDDYELRLEVVEENGVFVARVVANYTIEEIKAYAQANGWDMATLGSN